MVDTFLKKIEIKGGLIILIAGVFSAFLWDVRALLSLIFGGVLGLVNLRWISKTVKGILETKNPTSAKRALLFIYLLKLGILSLILIMILKTGRVNAPALLAGFTMIIAIIFIEGIIYAKRV
jgi:hypothetical protein